MQHQSSRDWQHKAQWVCKMGLAEELACNKPKKTPSHKTKSHVVKACENGKEKVIRFGQQGVKGSPKKKEVV